MLCFTLQERQSRFPSGFGFCQEAQALQWWDRQTMMLFTLTLVLVVPQSWAHELAGTKIIIPCIGYFAQISLITTTFGKNRVADLGANYRKNLPTSI